MFQFILNLFNSIFGKNKKIIVNPKGKKVAGWSDWQNKWQKWQSRWGGGSW